MNIQVFYACFFLLLRNKDGNCAENPNIYHDPLCPKYFLLKNTLTIFLKYHTCYHQLVTMSRVWALGLSLGLLSTGHHGSACLVFGPGMLPVGTGNTTPGRAPVEEMEWE